MQRLLRFLSVSVILLGFSWAQDENAKHVLHLSEPQSQHLRKSWETYIAAKAAYQLTVDELKTSTPEVNCSSEQIEIASDFTAVTFTNCGLVPQGPKATYPLPMKTGSAAHQ